MSRQGALAGRIVKATGGFYYVKLPDNSIVECRGRGIFRKQGRAPLVGDMVEIDVSPDDGAGTVMEIGARSNSLIRPPLANLDRMVLVISVTDPAPNHYVADKYLAILEHREIEAVVAVTKGDLADPAALAALYRGAGYEVYPVDPDGGEGLDALRALLREGISAFCGNSGVGKSTLLNAIDPRFALETGDTSKKLGRGRHTTRHVELYELPGGGAVADTPGFSSVEMLQMGHIPKEELAGCFREFAEHVGGCRFADCAHTCEAGCAVLEALADARIAPSRHKSYVQLYEEAREVKEWEHRGQHTSPR